MDAEQPAVKNEGKGDDANSSEMSLPPLKQLNLMQDPNLLAMLNAEDKTYLDLLANLPASVRRRVKALKKLQVESCKIEAEFYREVHALECKYAPKFDALSMKRKEIVTGAHEPNDEECNFTLDDEALAEELSKKATINGEAGQEKMDEQDQVKGIPEFWLQLFHNVELLAEMVQEHDEPILKHLQDIDVKLSNDPMGFKLIFLFSENEYFTNTVLEKEYTLKCNVDDATPFEFDGPEIISCKGCKIEWKPNKNVTVKLIKKKQKHKARGATRFVTKQVKADSFFNFFDPPEVPAGDAADDEMDDANRDIINADFEIGQILRDRIIPRAVLYFTGEAEDDDSFDEEDDDEDEELEDEDDTDESDGAEHDEAKENNKGGKGKSGEKPEECKQQ